MTGLCWTRVPVVLLSVFALVPLSAQTPQRPDLSGLTAEEHRSIESACSHEKYLEGPAAYNQCLENQLSKLSGSRRPDLSGLTAEEHRSIESACSHEKYLEGPAAYNQCLENQLSKLSGSRRPDLSRLTAEEHRSIESACSHEKYLEGPAAYNQCLENQLSKLSGSRRPDLSRLTAEEHRSIESACSREKYLEGPAAYHACVSKQINALGRATGTGPAAENPMPTALPFTSTTGQQVSGASQPKRLGYFLGTWTLDGDMKTSPFGPGGRFTGTQRNEWMSDGLSLASRWGEQRPTGSDSGKAVYSYDSNQKVYKYHGTDSEGETEDSTGTVEGDTWTWTSNPTLPNGETVKGRFTVKENSSTFYSFRFEIAPQHSEWMTVMEGRATKLK